MGALGFFLYNDPESLAIPGFLFIRAIPRLLEEFEFY